MVAYIEINLIAIIVGIILLIECYRITSKNETSQIIIKCMLFVLILFSASDIAAYSFRGVSYWGAQIANVLYFMLMAIGCYFWLLYICVKMRHMGNLKRLYFLTGIPISLLCIGIIINPWTGYFFTIDENIIYHRGSGIIITWLVEWGYIIAALIINIKALVQETRAYRKREIRGYLYFAVPMVAAAVFQMLFYGSTTSQIGFMVSMLMACINRQSHLVQKDELTGLNNKNAFLSFRDYMVNRTKAVNLTMLMMDADDFKRINDMYGHLKGDQALKDIAELLKAAVSVFTQRRVILYRYAGDEFIIIGTDLSDEDIVQLKQFIQAEVENMNNHNKAIGEKYTLGLSVGYATASCSDVASFDKLMAAADASMYEVKKARKKGR